MTDDGLPRGSSSAKTSAKASGRGQALAAKRDLMKRGITVNNSIILICGQRSEATDRERRVEELCDQVERLMKRLTVATQAARMTRSRLKRKARHARTEARALTLAEARVRLEDAECRRREAASRLDKALRERDQASQLMRQAQMPTADTRTERGGAH